MFRKYKRNTTEIMKEEYEKLLGDEDELLRCSFPSWLTTILSFQSLRCTDSLFSQSNSLRCFFQSKLSGGADFPDPNCYCRLFFSLVPNQCACFLIFLSFQARVSLFFSSNSR
ncbi:hypothetical protein Droror1_Dr00021305 [Drosera rotundifolia]